MTLRHLLSCLLLPSLLLAAAASAQETPAAAGTERPIAEATQWQDTRSFQQLGRAGDMLLLGIRNTEAVEFQVRRDRIVKQAQLDLRYTASPSLLPTLSHLRVYLNDALMTVLPVATDAPAGTPLRQQVTLDPRLIGDFNRVRLEFVGHYTDICEDPAHSSLWLNVAADSALLLQGQVLAMKDDLANFPLPFFDYRDPSRLQLPVVFAGQPSLAQQRSAALLASYFGSMAGWWRQASFPVSYDALPASGHAVVFATNERRPAFLAGHPPVDGPVVELMSVPERRDDKLLLVLGRNDEDLHTAVAALAAGDMLFRGTRVSIDELKPLKPRKPYDAPNWTRTDRPVRLTELLEYPQQLQANGVAPEPITVGLNLPPDLFIWRNQGIPLKLRYRYTPPFSNDESKLIVSINDQLISSFPLLQHRQAGKLDEIRLPVLNDRAGSGDGKLLIPALQVGERNRLRFDFSFSSMVGSAQRDRCQTMLPPNVQAAIEGDSSIDFSGFHHYMGLPNLSAFALSGFPFTRMADLSETVVLMPAGADAQQVGTLLDLVGGLGAQSGYPAFGLRLGDDAGSLSRLDADLIVVGDLPAAMRDKAEPAVLLQQRRSTLVGGHVATPAEAASRARTRSGADAVLGGEVSVSAEAPMAAIVGFQSPFHPQRSVVSLAASQDGDFQLLRDTLTDTGKRQAVAGSVAVIRSSGVSSQFVGEHYYVGTLPWWMLLWFHLSGHPVLLAVLAVVVVVSASFLLWRALRWVARRRLDPDA